jgi:hypothetical protein
MMFDVLLFALFQSNYNGLPKVTARPTIEGKAVRRCISAAIQARDHTSSISGELLGFALK